MPRNLDVAALRAFLTVLDLGGVTRAANQLNLTQSAVSLQIKRLEVALGQPLFARKGRCMTPTTQGEQLVAHARRILAANDETLIQMTALNFTGDISLGTPDDLLYPRVPCAMRNFTRLHPRIKVRLHTAQTATLKEKFARGAIDVILTTEAEIGLGAEALLIEPLVWIGAPGGRAWQKRPLPLGTVANCIFNKPAIASLNASAFDWQLEVDNVSNTAVEASIAADMIVRLQLRSTVDPQFDIIDHRGQLPALPNFYICMYIAQGPRRTLCEPLAGCLRAAFANADLLAAQ
jgi:DNA-binding transcriptional LysR family regulator